MHAQRICNRLCQYFSDARKLSSLLSEIFAADACSCETAVFQWISSSLSAGILQKTKKFGSDFVYHEHHGVGHVS